MNMDFLSVFVTLLLCCTTLLFQVSDAIECYVCSWSPKENRSDFCTSENFKPEMVKRDKCKIGCEKVEVRDRNDAVDNFFRNCYHDESGSYEEQCGNEDKQNHKRKFCRCFNNLCNAASLPTTNVLNAMFFTVGAIGLWLIS